MLIRTFTVIYLMLITESIIHELGHWISAKIMKVTVLNFVIGDEDFGLKIGRFYFSILPFFAYVTVKEEDLEKLNRLQLCLFYMSGNAFVFVFIIVAKFIIDSYYYKIIVALGVFNIFINSLPFLFKSNDMMQLIKRFK